MLLTPLLMALIMIIMMLLMMLLMQMLMILRMILILTEAHDALLRLNYRITRCFSYHTSHKSSQQSSHTYTTYQKASHHVSHKASQDIFNALHAHDALL